MHSASVLLLINNTVYLCCILLMFSIFSAGTAACYFIPKEPYSERELSTSLEVINQEINTITQSNQRFEELAVIKTLRNQLQLALAIVVIFEIYTTMKVSFRCDCFFRSVYFVMYNNCIYLVDYGSRRCICYCF